MMQAVDDDAVEGGPPSLPAAASGLDAAALASRDPLPCTSRLLYLHGFRSSPQSTKAQQLKRWFQRHHPACRLLIPQLPMDPDAALATLDGVTAGWPDSGCAVVGSSLGGFYARLLAQRRPHWRCVALNPAPDPAQDLAGHLGEHPGWQDPSQRVVLTAAHLTRFAALGAELQPPASHNPEVAAAARAQRARRCLTVAATGDELLSWDAMVANPWAGQILRVDGSDHALSDFETHLPQIAAFLKPCA